LKDSCAQERTTHNYRMPPSRKPIDVDADDDSVQDVRLRDTPEYPDASTEHHLSSISILYNRMNYHVLGRIVYDFRVDDPNTAAQVLSRITLVPLVNPQTQAEPTAIEVYFHGKWRNVCSSLKKRDIICIVNASVENAADPDYHEAQLAFYDRDDPSSPRQSPSQEQRVASLFLMHGETPSTRKPVTVVTQSALSQGFIPVPTSTPTPRSGTTNVPSVNSGGKTIKKRQRQPKKVARPGGGARGSRYEYRSVASLNEEAANMTGKGSTFNLYGVIIAAKAPSTCTGPDLRSTITILDESSITGTSDVVRTKVLEVYRFDRDPRSAIPFCVRGDIIRCHRLQLTKFTDRSGICHVQGHAQNHSTFLMWAADTNSEKPILEMAPVRGNAKSPIANHTMSDSDIIRVKALREFSKSYMEGLNCNVDRPWMKTVDQVVNAGIGADFLEHPLQILGKYIPSKNGPTGELGIIKFSIRDGLRENVTMDIQSVISADHRNKVAQFPYEAFARSLKIHNFACRDTKWMLINEIRVQRNNSTSARNGKLQVGRHTSTIEFLPKYAPEVRALLASVPKPTSSQGNGNGNGNTDYGGGNGNSNGHAAMDGISSQGLRDVAASVRAETEAERIAVRNALQTRWVTVGIHPGTHLKVDSVRSVVRAAKNDQRKLMRVQAKVCSMDSPENICDVTKLYCEACAVYMDDDSSDMDVYTCATCGRKATWTFKGRLVLADEDGTWIHAWVTDNEFFKPKLPRKIANTRDGGEEDGLVKWIHNVMEKLMETTTRFDCIVQPYAVENSYGISMPACRVVHTQVLQPLEDSGAV